MLNLDDAQVAAVLAGLRLLQRQGCPGDLEEVATSCGRFDLPGDGLIDALCEQVNASSGEIANWNMGEDDGDGRETAPDTRAYTVTHPHPTAAIRIEIEAMPAAGKVHGVTWIVDTELADGRPVVRCYRPDKDEPVSVVEFAAIRAVAG